MMLSKVLLLDTPDTWFAFQSLFSWMMLSKINGLVNIVPDVKFQSLFSWMMLSKGFQRW